MKCNYCDLDRNLNIIYQNDDLVVALKDNILTPGQVTIFPKKHYTIMELIPEEILKKCIITAKKVGIAVFEGLKCAGTNIIINNGISAGQTIPHFGIEVIPRIENDGLNFEWKGQELTEDQQEQVSLRIEQALTVKKEIKEEEKPKIKKEKNENYLLKSLRRIP
jgi:histidine triad (HIT) family protein